MRKIRYLHMPPGRTDLYFRRKVPEDMRTLFNCGEFYKVPLGTKDPRLAEPKVAIANGEFEQKLALFRQTLDRGAPERLSDDEACALVERYLTKRSNSGFASGGLTTAFVLRELDAAIDEIEGTRIPTAQSMSAEDWRAYRQRMTGDDDEFSEETQARLTVEHSLRNRPVGKAWFDYQSRTPRRRWRPLLTEAIAAMKREFDLPGGTVAGIDEPLADALASALRSPEIQNQLPVVESARKRGHTSRAQRDMKLGVLLDQWQANRSPSPKSVAAAKKAVELFTGYIGDVGIGEVTADDCFTFRDTLLMLPASMPRVQRKLGLDALITIYRHRTDLKKLSPQSVKKYVGAIQALLSFAFQERFVPLNVAAGIKVDGSKTRSDRRSFTEAELRALFKAPLFLEPWSRTHSRSQVSDMTLRWLFLLGLCTGGRIEELGQILLSDIKESNGNRYIDVSAHIPVADAEADATLSKRLKTVSSVRLIPLHPRLIDVGFIEHVQALREGGAIKLFADLKPDTLAVQTKEASRRTNRVIDRYGGKDPLIVFHSFRHSFKDFCREAGIPKDVHDQLTGHAPADVGGGYGVGLAVRTLSKHMKRIRIDMIDWPGIATARRL